MLPALDHLAELTHGDKAQLEAIFEAFEDALIDGQHPRIADYLPQEKRLRWAALVELVSIDLEFAIKSDSPAKIEDYLAAYPELSDDLDVLLKLIARDFHLRSNRGNGPPAREYVGRFPDLGDRLEACLKVEVQGPWRSSGWPGIKTAESTLSAEAMPSVLPGTENPQFDNLQLYAQGGLGDVYRARDLTLSREVALKRIRLKYSSQSRVRRRFLREARLTARLNHPGIVPIHGLIWDGQGQPWYVMRFVEGKTLAVTIEEYHQSLLDRPRLNDQPLTFRQLLARYVVVCNTIAFAHSRKVVHRDLKPSNIILGEYGETLVLDWGLATSTLAGQDERPASLEPNVLPTLGDREALTEAGQRIGTPAFMSPEQAQGLPAMNSPASDIYGLGVILYTILAGRPPFESETWESLHAQIVQGDYPRPRQVKADVPRALEAICNKAMALKPGDRYATASDLARDIERWEADESVSAWREPWILRARRWSRKHSTLLYATAAAAAAAVFLLVAFAGLRMIERWKTDSAASATFLQAEILASEARTTRDPVKWDRAMAEVLRARERLESGGSIVLRNEMDTRLKHLRAEQSRLHESINAEKKDRRVVSQLDEARIQHANLKDEDFDFDAMHEAYLTAFRDYGIDVATLPVEEAARRIRASKIADDMIAALDEWSGNESAKVPNTRLASIARKAESDPARTAVRNAVDHHDVAALRRLIEREEDRRKLGPRLRAVFVALRSLDPVESFPLLETVRREHPSDFWLNHDLGMAYLGGAKPPRLPEALRCLSVAVGLRPDSPGAHLNLGVALGENGDLGGAIAEYREALRLRPSYATAHNNMGYALYRQGKLDEAIAEYREALRIQPGAARSRLNLGIALTDRKKPEEAIAEFRAVLRSGTLLAEAHVHLGATLYDQGKTDEAFAEYRKALRLRPDFYEARSKLGIALSLQKKWDEAGAEFLEAVRLRPDSAEARVNFGNALAGQGKYAEAEAQLREALRLKPNFELARFNLSSILQLQRKPIESADLFNKAPLNPPDPNEAINHYNLGLHLNNQGKLDEALTQYGEALRLRPDYPEALCNFGLILGRQGKFREALERLQRGHELGLRQTGWKYPSQEWVRRAQRQVELDEMLPAVLKGEIAPKGADERLEMAWVCASTGRYEAATRFAEVAFQEKPALAASYLNETRFHAAQWAAQAGSGRDRDHSPIDQAARKSLREKALSWLRSNLTAWNKFLEGGNQPNRNQTVARTLAFWEHDPQLAGIREDEALTKLSADERELIRLFWSEVEVLRRKAMEESEN